MKKLVTWISRVGKQFQSTISLGKRSIDRLLSVTCSRISVRFGHLPIWQAVSQGITALQQFTQPFWAKFRLNKRPAPTKSGLIETFNQRYLKLPPPFSAFLKPLIIVVSLVSAYALLGFYALPALLKTKLPALIQEHTGRKASVGNIEFNPFELAASLHDFKMLEKNGTPFVSFEHFNFDFNGMRSIKTMAVVIDEISLKKPTVHLAKLKDGKFNFADMTTGKKTEPKKIRMTSCYH